MIKIKNIYHMLTYAFRSLNKNVYANIAMEKFEHIADLLAAILVQGINSQLKRGLGKDYVQHTQPLSTPKGKMNVSQSIKTQSLIRKKIVCNFDVFTENDYMNQILKTTMNLLLRSPDVTKENKKELKKLWIHFSNVDQINYNRIQWTSLKYHRNNFTYKMLMNICYLIIEGLLLTEKEGSYRLAKFLDDQKLHTLFERFVLEYYRKHFPQFHASASYINWNIDGGEAVFLPAMRTDVTLQYNDRILIIDTKLYSKTMQTHFHAKSYHSQNMYQIFTYVKNKDAANTGNVSGVLLYAKTDEGVTPDQHFFIDGNRIGVQTLDLDTDFIHIKNQLNTLAKNFLSD